MYLFESYLFIREKKISKISNYPILINFGGEDMVDLFYCSSKTDLDHLVKLELYHNTVAFAFMYPYVQLDKDLLLLQ